MADNWLTKLPKPPNTDPSTKPNHNINIHQTAQTYLRKFNFPFLPPVTSYKTKMSAALWILKNPSDLSDKYKAIHTINNLTKTPIIYHKDGGSRKHKYSRKTRRRRL